MAGNETVIKPYPTILEIPSNDIEFGEPIGHGGTCSVLKGVWKTKKDFPVAIKRLNHFREIEIVTFRKIKADEEKKHIGRKFIIEILGVSKMHDMDCIIMEYAANGSLYHYLSQKRKQQQLLENEKFFTWIRQGALAIQYLHKLDIIHRDIKSPNFLITDKHNLKVCDFGISCITDKTVTTTYTGSLPWMAPENFEAFFKCRGSKIKVSKRSDIYSYGVVIWEMRTLLEPDPTKMVDGMYPLDDETPSKLKDILHGCWEKDRMKRPSIPDILQTMQDLSITMEVKVKDFIETPDDRPFSSGDNDVEETLAKAYWLQQHTDTKPIPVQTNVEPGTIVHFRETSPFVAANAENETRESRQSSGYITDEEFPPEELKHRYEKATQILSKDKRCNKTVMDCNIAILQILSTELNPKCSTGTKNWKHLGSNLNVRGRMLDNFERDSDPLLSLLKFKDSRCDFRLDAFLPELKRIEHYNALDIMVRYVLKLQKDTEVNE